MTTTLIVHYGNDPLYLGIVWQLAQDEQKAGHTPVLLDLADVVGHVGDGMNRRALRAFRISSPDERFGEVLRDAGFETHEGRDFIAEGASFVMSADGVEAIRETTRSALISFSRDPFPNLSKRMWARLERDLVRAASNAYAAVSAFLVDRPEIETVYVLNGRFPHQRAVLEAATDQNRAIRHYEKGDKADTYWSSAHSTLDRVATQSSVDAVLSELSDDAARELGRGWMARRSASGSHNIYSRFFGENGDSHAASTHASTKLVGLFTSSQDEFASLGPEWHIQAWKDQWEAFDHVLTHLGSAGYSFYLRVHPNFATKSRASFVRERAQVLALAAKHPSLRVIWHDEQVNSYLLVNDTDIVVVWDSTIGLEASGRGKPVWELAASYYDLYADVRQWFSPADAPEPNALEYDVDVRRAERFMAYIDIREPDLSTESIGIRESITPPGSIGLRIANVLSSGGAPTPRIAFASIVDSVRHRRSAINVKAARNALAPKGR